MAASDQQYRSQKALDIVFGVTCVLMLASVVWMFAQDYFRDFKAEQRTFRNVETAMAERGEAPLEPAVEALLAFVGADLEDLDAAHAPAAPAGIKQGRREVMATILAAAPGPCQPRRRG